MVGLVPAFKAPFVAVEVHAPDIAEVPNGDIADGVVAPELGTSGIVLTPATPLKSALELGAAPATSVAGHAVIVPMALPNGGLRLPRLSWIEPN